MGIVNSSRRLSRRPCIQERTQTYRVNAEEKITICKIKYFLRQNILDKYTSFPIILLSGQNGERQETPKNLKNNTIKENDMKNKSLLIAIGLLVVSLVMGSSLLYGYTNFWGYGNGQITSVFKPFQYWSGCYGNPSGSFIGQWRDDSANTGTFIATVVGNSFSGHWWATDIIDTMGHVSGYISDDTVYNAIWTYPKKNPTTSGTFWSFYHEEW
jgi:hypothetical protein